jgi:hypothetical protein
MFLNYLLSISQSHISNIDVSVIVSLQLYFVVTEQVAQVLSYSNTYSNLYSLGKCLFNYLHS